MPKSAKKRKDKAADFTKAKLKLGKGKQVASNAVDTSYKARSIALPTQSISAAKDAEYPTTKRKLTFEDLISHSKHFNAGIRRDALSGLRELLDSHWDLLDSSLNVLLNAIARMIGDEDASVRKSFLSFVGWLLPRMSSADLEPHSPMLILFASSAQTHIFPEIRIDGTRFLDLLLEQIPKSTVSGWEDESVGSNGSRILKGYLGLLNAGTRIGNVDNSTSLSTFILTPASKLVVLKSLSLFLSFALSKEVDGPLKLHSPSKSFLDIENLLVTKTRALSDSSGGISEHSPLELGSSLQTWDLLSCSSRMVLSAESTDDGQSLAASNLARTLKSTVIAVFLDNAPAAFSMNDEPSLTELESVLAASQIAVSLYRTALQRAEYHSSPTQDIADLTDIIGHMYPYFPFKVAARRDIKVEEYLQEINVNFCELTALISTRATPTHSMSARLSLHTDRVRDFVLEGLGGDGSSFRTSYTPLIPTMWSFVVDSDASGTLEVFKAVLAHATGLSSKSSLVRPSVGFISRLLLLPTDRQYTGSSIYVHQPETRQDIQEWLTNLPRLLWELGGSNLELTDMIFVFLLRILQRRPKYILADTLAILRHRFIPFFSIQHPNRGQILGPFRKLPVAHSSRRLVLDVMLHFVQDGPSAEAVPELKDAIGFAVARSDDEVYWRQINP